MLKEARKIVGPAYRAIRRNILGKTKTERRNDEIKEAYKYIRQISKYKNIDTISFSSGECIIELVDGRKYYYDNKYRASKLYSVPIDGKFESKETEYLGRSIKRDFVCIDVGACFGWYTVLYGKIVGENGEVHAFEPLPENYYVLESNIKLNKLNNVTLNNIALDKEIGDRDVFLPDKGVSGSFKLHDYDDSFEKIGCKTNTLTNYCKSSNISKVDFIKADIEGGELDMLKGGIEILERDKPMLMVEIQEHSTNLFGYAPSAIFNLLGDLGYLPFYVTEEGSLENVNIKSDELPDYNFIFRHKESI